VNALGVFPGYLEDMFPALPLPFEGVLRIVSPSSAISVVGLRIRINERGFLLTTTPPTDEISAPPSTEFDFPQIANGSGWTTQFNLFSGATGQATNGTLQFVTPVGVPYPLTINNLIAPPPVVALTSISPARAALGSTITLTGAGMSFSDAIVFTSASSTVNAAPSGATATSLTVAVPSNAITGPVYVQNGSQATASQVLEIVAPSGLPIQTSVSVGVAATVSGVDIYVPEPAGTLNFTDIGIGDVGTPIGASGGSVTVTRGQTKQLLLCYGVAGHCSTTSGFSPTSTVSISGGGLTVRDFAFQSGAIFVTIVVDPSAAPGPRNVMVRNSNGDISSMTGGLIIQ
jgi:hypothetical protein